MAKVLHAVVAEKTAKISDDWIDLGVQKFTPERAAEYLLKVPPDNIQRMGKKKDRTRIERMKRAMERGEWQTNPASRILLGRDDLVLDGRGRLTAVAESGVSILSYVSKNPTRSDATGLVVDQAVARDASYVLQRPVRLVRVANVAFYLVKNRPADFSDLDPFCDQFLPIYNALEIENKRGVGTSASVQLAAIMCVAGGKSSAGYLQSMLALIARRNPKELPPLPYSFYRQITSERLDSREQLARAFRALQERNQHLNKLQIKNTQAVIDEIRHIIRVSMPEWR